MKRLCIVLGASSFILGIFFAWYTVTHLPHTWPKYQRITCINNLKQIGLSFRQWALDYKDQYPFSVSTNAGGTKEFCDREAAGFDKNSYIHFRAVSNELGTPLVLRCPQDRTKEPGRDFGKLLSNNVTYRLRSDTSFDSAPTAALAVCPIDGNILQNDGMVIGKTGSEQRGRPLDESRRQSFRDVIDYDANVRRRVIWTAALLAFGLAVLGIGMFRKNT